MIATKHHKWGVTASLIAVVIVLAMAGFGVYSIFDRPAPMPFQHFTIMQITNSGRATRAAISPDGKYVLSVTDENGMQSLWLRNVPTGRDTQVVAPTASTYVSLAFSPDGNFIYFRKSVSRNIYNLYRTPVLGNTPQTIARDARSDAHSLLTDSVSHTFGRTIQRSVVPPAYGIHGRQWREGLANWAGSGSDVVSGMVTEWQRD